MRPATRQSHALRRLLAAAALLAAAPCSVAESGPADCEALSPRAPHAETGPLAGRVLVRLAPASWRPLFESPGPAGLGRLRPATPLVRLLDCYGIERVWRAMPQLERTSAGKVEVIGYREAVVRSSRGARPGLRPYPLPDLAGQAGVFHLAFPPEADIEGLLPRLRALEGVESARPLRVPVPTPPAPARVPLPWPPEGRGAAPLPTLVVAVLDVGLDVTHPALYRRVFLNPGELPGWLRQALGADGPLAIPTPAGLERPGIAAALARNGCTAAGAPCRDTNANGYPDAEDAVAWWSDGEDDDHNGLADDIAGWDFLEHHNRPFEVGEAGHGTRVAGLIAEHAPRAALLPVASAFGLGELAYALDLPQVRVVAHAMSWSYKGADDVEVDALLATLNPEGVLLVAALGNQAGFYYGADPARREPVLTVGGHDGEALVGGHGPKTDLAAPAGTLYTTTQRTRARPGGRGTLSGTSAATALASAAAARLLAADPTLSPEQVRQVLRMTARGPWHPRHGWGRLDAERALAQVRAGRLYPEANITSLPVNRVEPETDDERAVYSGRVPIHALLGLPQAPDEPVRWVLRRGRPWDLGDAVVIGRGKRGYSDGALPLITLDTSAWPTGRHLLELAVTTRDGITARDRAVIDLE